jgi:hypothetical protein
VVAPSFAFVFIAPWLLCLRPTSYFRYRHRSSCNQLLEVSKCGRSKLLTSDTLRCGAKNADTRPELYPGGVVAMRER